MTGRFINGDHIGYIGINDSVLDYNLFTYCYNCSTIFFDPTGHYVVYIYGYNDLQPSHAKKNKKLLEKKYTVYLHEISFTSAFTNIWNNKYKGNRGQLSKIDIVIINLHGSYKEIKYVDFSKLKRRSIDTLLLLSCNAGHQDHSTTNPAYRFFKNNNIRQMVCCDGTHLRKSAFYTNNVKLSVIEDHAYTQALTRNKKRKSKGFMLYKKNGSQTIKMSIGHSFDSITELLKKIGKW